MKIYYTIFLVSLSLVSCQYGKDKKEQVPSEKEIQRPVVFLDTIVVNNDGIDTVVAIDGAAQQKIHLDTVQFKEFNDNGDYFLFMATKGKEEVSFIYNDDIPDRDKLARGDELSIEWELDSIRNAGDDEVLDYVKRLRKAKKIKDGKVSLFRREHDKAITYVSNTEIDNYSDHFINQVHNIVEYVVANSKAETLQRVLHTPKATLLYSITEVEKANRMYYVFHISSKMDGQLEDIQQIYQDVERATLYEYDPVTDSLTAIY